MMRRVNENSPILHNLVVGVVVPSPADSPGSSVAEGLDDNLDVAGMAVEVEDSLPAVEGTEKLFSSDIFH